MAKLIQCKDCGNQISKNAASCPNCGAKNKQTSIITWLALIFIGIPVLWSVFNGASNESDTTPIDAATTPAEIATTEPNETLLPESVSNWNYSDSTDEMRGTVANFAQTRSLNQIQLDSPYRGGTSLYLMLRNMPDNGNELMISTDNGQLWCEYQNCYMSVKFDDNEVKQYPLAKAAAGSSTLMFLDSSTEQFINELKNSNKVTIETGFFKYGNQQFSFDTSDLEWSY